MRVKHKILEGQANRLRVFRAIKSFIAVAGRWPTIDELQERVSGLDRSCLWDHRNALRHADGLVPSWSRLRPVRSMPLAVMDLGGFGERDAA